MRRRSKRGNDSRIEDLGASSMSDIVFTLLMFFMVVAINATESAVNINLPKYEKSEKKVTNLKLFISKDREFTLNKKIYRNLEALKQGLSIESKHLETPKILISADTSFNLQETMDLGYMLTSEGYAYSYKTQTK